VTDAGFELHTFAVPMKKHHVLWSRYGNVATTGRGSFGGLATIKRCGNDEALRAETCLRRVETFSKCEVRMKHHSDALRRK
jgi:hypothetical protein